MNFVTVPVETAVQPVSPCYRKEIGCNLIIIKVKIMMPPLSRQRQSCLGNGSGLRGQYIPKQRIMESEGALPGVL